MIMSVVKQKFLGYDLRALASKILSEFSLFLNQVLTVIIPDLR